MTPVERILLAEHERRMAERRPTELQKDDDVEARAARRYFPRPNRKPWVAVPEVAEAIRTLRAQGLSLTAISRQLSIPRSTVSRSLKRSIR